MFNFDIMCYRSDENKCQKCGVDMHPIIGVEQDYSIVSNSEFVTKADFEDFKQEFLSLLNKK